MIKRLTSSMSLSRATLRTKAGFTLVEVLVALGIFAVLSSGYLIATSEAVRGLGRLQDKVFALWIAQDTVTRMRSIESEQADSLTAQTVTFLDREWQISFNAEATDNARMRRVTIFVATDDDPESQLATLETYFPVEQQPN